MNKVLAKKRPRALSKLMEISNNLAELNWERNQKFSIPFDPTNARPAIYAFNGDVYQGLDAYSIPEIKLDGLQDTLRILSGLYGVLKPEQEWIDLATMTEFCFPDNPSCDHESAVIRAFFKNRLYFKFNPDRFFPNSEEQVIRIVSREKEDARKKQIITDGASWIKSVLNDNFPLSKSFTEKKTEFVDILKSAYLFEKENS